MNIPLLKDDFNGNGRSQIPVTSPWGLGILELSGGSLASPMMAANGTPSGGWVLSTADNRFVLVGDLDGDQRAEMLVTSSSGIGVLKQAGGAMNAVMIAENGTRFGGWLLNTRDNRFGPAGDFDGDGQLEILITSPWGIAILKLSGGTFNALAIAPNGTRFGDWPLNTKDNRFGPVGDVDGDGRAEILVSSPSGVGILKLSGGSLTVPFMAPNGARFGDWVLNTVDNEFGTIADYDGDGRAELLVTSPWGLGILKFSGAAFTSFIMVANGTRIGQWLLNTRNDRLGLVGDYDGDRRDEILLVSGWGIGIMEVTGAALAVNLMFPNGTRFGDWLLNTANDHFEMLGDYDGDGRAEIVVTSSWGMGILDITDGAINAPMLAPNGTRLGGWLLNTSDNRFGMGPEIRRLHVSAAVNTDSMAAAFRAAFEKASEPDALTPIVMHTIERGLSGTETQTELDRAFQVLLARYPAVSRTVLQQIVGAYHSVPIELKMKVMSRNLAELTVARPLDLALARTEIAAVEGGTFLFVPGVDKAVAAKAPSSGKPAIELPRELPRPDLRDNPFDPGADAPRITTINGILDSDNRRKLIIKGFHFVSSSVACVVYLRPRQGQRLDETGFRVVDGEKVVGILAKVVDELMIEAALPVGIPPGEYDVRVVVSKGSQDRSSDWYVCKISPFHYTVRFLEIRCIDESDPEWGDSDEIVSVWEIYCDGDTWAKSTGEKEGFNDGVVKPYDLSESRVFMLDKTNNVNAAPGAVSHEILIETSLFESDEGEVKQGNTYLGFASEVAQGVLGGLGYAGAAKVLAMLTPMVQKLLTILMGDSTNLGKRPLFWTASELESLTDNPERKFNGELQFLNDDDDGSYSVTYEVQRFDPS